MKKGVEIIKMKYRTPEWHAFRENGIGGSEVGTVLGINHYDTWMRIYHEKVGTADQKIEDNTKMFWGSEHEDKIAQIWQYWDDTPGGYVNNKSNNRIIRKCRNVNGYIVNPKYPWLFASLDRLINIKGGANFITGEPLEHEVPLECKTLSYWAASVWESGIPQYFLVQVQTYMIILEVDYAEIAILKDGNDFRVEYVQQDQAMAEKIIEVTKSFWYDRIVPAKEACQRRNEADISGDVAIAEKYDAIIQRLEPPPDDTQAYKDYMSMKFLKERDRVQGSFALFEVCREDELLKKIIKKLAVKRKYTKNQMIEFLVNNHSDLIDFGNDGNVRWVERRNSTVKSLVINLKEKPSEYVIDREVDRLDLTY